VTKWRISEQTRRSSDKNFQKTLKKYYIYNKILKTFETKEERLKKTMIKKFFAGNYSLKFVLDYTAKLR